MRNSDCSVQHHATLYLPHVQTKWNYPKIYMAQDKLKSAGSGVIYNLLDEIIVIIYRYPGYAVKLVHISVNALFLMHR